MPAELEAFDVVILKLEKKEEKLKKECSDVRITIETLLRERGTLSPELTKRQYPMAVETVKPPSVSRTLREFVPQYLRDNHPKRLLKSDIVNAVEKRNIGAGTKSLVALISKALTELVKSNALIKEVDKNNTYYTSKLG